MQYKRFVAAVLTLILAFCGLGITSALADSYNMPYYIEVDLTNQLITVYNTKDNSIAYQMLCSSGKNNATPTGTWYLPPKTLPTERGEWYLMKSYNCWVKYATKISGPYFFHSIPFTGKNNNAMNANAAREFGIPASHGCIRLRVEDARYIAENCLAGTRCRIFKSNQKNEELRTLLYISSYNQASGISYQEFMGISKDALGSGSKGDDVMELQMRIHDLGYYDDAIDGYYGISTVTAVKNLQKDLGLAQSGITSVELKELIFSDAAPVSMGQITLTEGSSGPVVKQFQTALKQLGLYDGDIDSVYDLDVIEAVKELQLICGYNTDGIATPEIQHLAYYEVNRLQSELGDDYTLERITEEITMATMNFKKSKIYVHSQPKTSSSELAKLGYGDEVIVLAVKDEWAQVFTGGVTGYMYKKYLTPYVEENYVYRYTAPSGKSITIGNTVEQMQNGTGTSEQVAFRKYYANAQYMDYLDDPVEYATVSTNSDQVKLNLRSEPSSDADILAEISNGTNLRVLSKDSDWTRVGYDDHIGYLMNQYLTFWEGTPADLESSSDTSGDDVYEELDIKAVVIAAQRNGLARIYQKADTNSRVVGSVGNDRQVKVLAIDEDTDWVYVSYGNTKGFMQDKYLAFRLNA